MIRHLYMHIPFCHRICPYCGFYKHLPGKADYRGFVRAMVRELAWAAERWELRLETVSAGGGTPSILPGEVWRELAEGVVKVSGGGGIAEWTLEANPKTFGVEKARAWLASGVTRVSLGAQSLDDGVLRTLGRDHGGEEAVRGFGDLREAGFGDVNVDLMFAVPGQTVASWGKTLERVAGLGPEHVSAYNLTYEEDTEFLRRVEAGRWNQDGDRDAKYFELAHGMLTEAGFEHYEISNYARAGRRSRHNQAYWRGADYLGIGPSAISTVEGVRSANVSDTERYRIQVEAVGHGRSEAEQLSEENQRLEALALGLRTVEGIAERMVAEERVDELVKEELAERREGRVRLTLEGMMVADEVAGYLI